MISVRLAESASRSVQLTSLSLTTSSCRLFRRRANTDALMLSDTVIPVLRRLPASRATNCDRLLLHELSHSVKRLRNNSLVILCSVPASYPAPGVCPEEADGARVWKKKLKWFKMFWSIAVDRGVPLCSQTISAYNRSYLSRQLAAKVRNMCFLFHVE